MNVLRWRLFNVLLLLQLLLDAVESGDIVAIMRILPHSRQDDIDRIHKPPLNCTVLHVACTHGNASIVQLLIWVSFYYNII